MTSKKHRMIVCGVAVQLLAIAFVCYAFFPVQSPEEPIRLMYQTNAGKVLFDHQTHTGDKGYGLDCFDCHHHPPDDEGALIACGQCHLPKPKPKEEPKAKMDGMLHFGPLKMPEADTSAEAEESEASASIPESCLECHDASDVEDSEYPNHPDALHQQCIGCHDQYEKGPRSGSDDCSKCHVI